MTSTDGRNRVLVLEDEAVLAEAIGMLLEPEGCDTTVTPSGTDALLLAAREPFDAAIVDLQVESLSGAAVWQVLKDLSDVPVVAMSASAAPWQDDAFRAGVSACVPKAALADALSPLVKSLVEAHKRQSDHQLANVEDLSAEDLKRLRAMSEEEKDRLPFGLIRVDKEGVIVGFNRYEAEASGYAPEDVIGRRFSDVAPCSKVKKLADALDAAVRDPSEHHVVRFRFPRRGAVAVVTVRAFYDDTRDQLWIFVSQRAGNGAR